MIGKTGPDRIRYGSTSRMDADRRRKGRPPISQGALGVMVPMTFDINSTLKQRIRDAASALRASRDPELVAARDALYLEAIEKGWTPAEIGRAAMTSGGVVRSRIAVLRQRAAA